MFMTASIEAALKVDAPPPIPNTASRAIHVYDGLNLGRHQCGYPPRRRWDAAYPSTAWSSRVRGGRGGGGEGRRGARPAIVGQQAGCVMVAAVSPVGTH
jgi:hypothetical protein